MNANYSTLSDYSDYEPNNGSSTERDILSSVLHVADKFCLPISESDAGDQLGGGGNSALRTAPPTLKNIRTLDDINAMVALATSEATRQPMTDNAIISELIQDILLDVLGRNYPNLESSDASSVSSLDEDAAVVDGPFVSRIVHDVSASIVSIPRCVGVHDLHLDSSKALLDGSASAAHRYPAEPPLLLSVPLQQHEQQAPAVPLATVQSVEGGDVPMQKSADGVGDETTAKASQTDPQLPAALADKEHRAKSTNTTTSLIESITHIIDYDDLRVFNETVTRMNAAGGRVESVGSAQSVGLAGLLARKHASRPSSVSLRGTWSRIKKAFSTISGRSLWNN